MAKRPKGRTLRVARHEAAHAVVAERLGGWVVRVVLEEEGSTGYCEHKGVSCPVELAVIACAGKAAEERWNRLAKRDWPYEDYRTLRELGISSQSAALLMETARKAVAASAPYIDRVARELVKCDLTGRHLRALLRSMEAEGGQPRKQPAILEE